MHFLLGTLSVFSGSTSLHRVTQIESPVERLVAVMCFATKDNIKNTSKVQELFWGRFI